MENRVFGAEFQKHISYHAVYEAGYIQAITFARKNGFRGIQIAVETPHFSPFSLSETEIHKIRNILKVHDQYLIFHGPDDITSLYESHPLLSDAILRYYSDLFDIAEKLHVPLITIHLGKITTYPTAFTDGRNNIEYPAADFPHYINTLSQNLSKLVEIADGRFRLCVENYHLHPGILAVLDPFLEKNLLCLCWDLAKTYRRDGSLNAELEQFFLSRLPKVKQVHLHDFSPSGRGHKVIGHGSLDFHRYLILLEGGAVEDFCIEVRPGELAAKSLNVLRNL